MNIIIQLLNGYKGGIIEQFKSLSLLIFAIMCIYKGVKMCEDLSLVYKKDNDKTTSLSYDVSIIKLYSKIVCCLFGIAAIFIIAYLIITICSING